GEEYMLKGADFAMIEFSDNRNQDTNYMAIFYKKNSNSNSRFFDMTASRISMGKRRSQLRPIS
ncbi:MAG: hypothetical protein ACPIOQ_04660, partial [Promethearchaeia archaeon]